MTYSSSDVDSYSRFEILMGTLFHHLHGSTTEPLREQAFWDDIQSLKHLAIQDSQGGAGYVNYVEWYWNNKAVL